MADSAFDKAIERAREVVDVERWVAAAVCRTLAKGGLGRGIGRQRVAH